MKISEMRLSLSGEISYYPQGSPALFIRLAGCNLSKRPCRFCDTHYALTSDNVEDEKVVDLVQRINNYANKKRVIVITGGEPLLQSHEVVHLVTELKYHGFNKIVVETNGTYNARQILPDIEGLYVVADCKPPSSGNDDLMEIKNFVDLYPGDVIKFPVQDETDFNFAVEVRDILEDFGFECLKAISPVFEKKEIKEEAYGLLKKANEYGFIVSVQLHKLIGMY